jgi:hypothetical protein
MVVALKVFVSMMSHRLQVLLVDDLMAAGRERQQFIVARRQDGMAVQRGV